MSDPWGGSWGRAAGLERGVAHAHVCCIDGERAAAQIAAGLQQGVTLPGGN